MNVRDKGKVLRELKQKFALDLAQIAAVGDDLNDISMFNESHLNFAPNDCASAFKDGTLKITAKHYDFKCQRWLWCGA